MSLAVQAGGRESPQLQRLGIAATEELRQAVRAALTELVGHFLKQFALALNGMAGKVAVASERSQLLDQARSITSNAGRWIETFVQHVDAHLTGGTVPERKRADEGGPDDSVTLANVELKAEARYHKPVTELDARVNRLRLMLYVPVFTKAVAPAGLCRALHDTADALEWPNRQRRVLFEHFDAIAIPELERVYRTLNEALIRIGTAATKAAAESAKAPPPPPRKAKSAVTMEPPPDPTKIDLETTTMLQNFALKSDGTGYSDSLLAADLLALADHRPLPGVAADQSWVPLQRITVAGHFLNEVIADPMVPEELKPQHESVRFPLVKSALTDHTLFTSATHPLGSLVHEMLLKSATSRINGNVETKRVAELLQQVLVQFDLAPEFVRSAVQTAGPMQDTQIHRFFELQRQQAQQRRDFVINEAKRVVMRQLEQATFGRGTPPTAIKFLHSAWGPLLTKRVLQHGADHALWKAGLALMEQLLDQLDARQPSEPPSREWHELMQTLVKALVAEGMPEERANVAVSALEAARKSPPVDIA